MFQLDEDDFIIHPNFFLAPPGFPFMVDLLLILKMSITLEMIATIIRES